MTFSVSLGTRRTCSCSHETIMFRLARTARLAYRGVRLFSDAPGKGAGGGGSIRSAGGKFSEMEMAREEQYFRILQQQQLEKLREHIEEAKEHHEEEIKTHDEAIAELEEQIEWHKKKKRRHEEKLEEKKDLLDGSSSSDD